jgi:MFS family permease
VADISAPVIDEKYKWTALATTTMAMLVVTINASIVIISLPAVFRGLGLDPLSPGNISYLLWLLMGYLLVTAVLVVTFGRLGDLYGRAKLFNWGFGIFTIGSAACALVPSTGSAGAIELISLRVLQGIGGAMVMANSTALLTDAFPATQRGFALGINQVAALAGQFLGLVIGGLLAEWSWRGVFWVSVPFGVVGTYAGFRHLRDIRPPQPHRRMDWGGNVTFALGLVAVLVAITYGIQPYGTHTMGWLNPTVLAELIGGVLLLVAFWVIESRVAEPMVDLKLFRIKAFAAGNLAGLLGAISRGGLQFMLILWLQGIWLPLHGYRFDQTPLWAGIYLLPLTIGFLIAGPASGYLSDKFGARAFATGGLLLAAASFAGMLMLPTDFDYTTFAALLTLNGIGFGLFAAPNTTAIMNAVPANERGAASGVRATFMNAGMVLSIGIFFSLMIAGLSARLPTALSGGLTASGVPQAAADRAGSEPAVGSLFAAFLGYNPVERLVGTSTLDKLPAATTQHVTGTSFFPQLIADPFKHGLVIVFIAAIAMSLVAALASLLRGGKFVHEDDDGAGQPAASTATNEATANTVTADAAANTNTGADPGDLDRAGAR